MSQRRIISTSLAALSSVVAASTCCIPLGTILAAAGTAGASAFLDTAPVWLMPLSFTLIGIAFWQTYSKRGERRPLAGQLILWTSAALVAGMFLFPQQIAIFVADFASTQAAAAPAGQPPVAEMDVASFRHQFNASAGGFRVLILLSPS